MPTKKAAAQSPRMSDEAVKAKTGKPWKDWFAILDKAGGKKMTHQEIVKYLDGEYGVGSWWRQMITTTYEQKIGRRSVHEKPDGYEISVSRTIGAPVAKLYSAFGNQKTRAKWLQEDGLVQRTAIENKSMRVTWNDKKTVLAIAFLEKGHNKSQIVVQHMKLPNASAATKMKNFWGAALDRLRSLVES